MTQVLGISQPVIETRVDSSAISREYSRFTLSQLLQLWQAKTYKYNGSTENILTKKESVLQFSKEVSQNIYVTKNCHFN